MPSDKMSEGEAAHTQKSGSPQLEELRARLKRELATSTSSTNGANGTAKAMADATRCEG